MMYCNYNTAYTTAFITNRRYYSRKNLNNVFKKNYHICCQSFFSDFLTVVMISAFRFQHVKQYILLTN
jgi:hypothetical protein